jgi:hypothetical protein
MLGKDDTSYARWMGLICGRLGTGRLATPPDFSRYLVCYTSQLAERCAYMLEIYRGGA